MPIVVMRRPSRRLAGMQALDLSVADPEPTRNLALVKSGGAEFQKHSRENRRESAWRLGREGLQLELELPYQHGVNLILELCRTEPGEEAGAESEAPAAIIVKGHQLRIDISPHNLEFHHQAWYLPQYMLEKGKNRISLCLAPDAGTDVLVKQVSVMRFDIQQQEQTNWCWAAVTSSLLAFFNPGKAMSQCEVVRECFRDTEFETEEDCCRKKVSEACNREFKLVDALDWMDLLSTRCFYQVSLDEIRRQINLGAPIAIRIEWKKGGGHFVVITAVGPQHPRGDGHTWLRVADPKRESAVYITYNTLKKRYRGDGEWTHTYMFEAERKRNRPVTGKD
ncbi:MAG: papain-like cysteine protease family protein [Blastocatellia bacterium]